MDKTVKGKDLDSLSGSKSVARDESDNRNLGGPETYRRTNYGSQAGREDQRQEDRPVCPPGFRSVHSSLQQGPRGPEASEGADHTTQPGKETKTVRTTGQTWQTSLQAIATKAAQTPHHRFGGLYRLLNQDSLRECFKALRRDAAPGVDGVSFQDYASDLEANLENLVKRLKNQSYHAKLVRRKYIPKGQGKLRPLGIPAQEDKLLQCAVAQILQAIYEADFLPCSYGYRPERGAQDAVRELTGTLARGRYEFVVEADIKGFFDNIDHDWLLKMLALRIQDGALLGLIRKWLRAGILEEEGWVKHPETGTPQGGLVSPVLANVYLHYVLDLWFKRRVKKANQGACELFRYADDFVSVFERRYEAERFEADLKERLKQFGLEAAPDKTQRLRFGRGGGEHNGRFVFLGFEFRWELSRKGKPIVKRRTAPKKLRAAVERFTEWIQEKRHRKLPELMRTLRQKYTGHWNYYGVIGNSRSLGQYAWQTERILFKWLNRRSQRRSYTWKAVHRLLERFQIPKPRIVEKAQAGAKRTWEGTKEQNEQATTVDLFGKFYRPAHAHAS